ncbi:hypothetical protein N7G274_007144 [Stereocaulon virgatum]|uniref:Uncharacterized protein n=1 Tax=Stereocaulon virgatum TaxID=373712 RepID=A0ABR4A4G0_9LECA
MASAYVELDPFAEFNEAQEFLNASSFLFQLFDTLPGVYIQYLYMADQQLASMRQWGICRTEPVAATMSPADLAGQEISQVIPTQRIARCHDPLACNGIIFRCMLQLVSLQAPAR